MKKKVFVYILILLISAHSMAACGRKPDILAKIDNKVITAEEFKSRIAALPARYQEFVKENKRRFLDELIVDELLYKEALRQDLEKDKEVRNMISEARKKILIARLLKDKVADAISVSDEDIENYYKSHQDEFKTPEILRASHIMVKTEEEAKDILLELANNRNFEDLARSRSIDPTAEKGGDIGYFVTGQLDPEFDKVCFELEPGQISNVVKTRFGYHIIKLTEKKPPDQEKFEDVKARIKQDLTNSLRKKHFSDFVQRLKDRAKIEIYEDSSVLTENQ